MFNTLNKFNILVQVIFMWDFKPISSIFSKKLRNEMKVIEFVSFCVILYVVSEMPLKQD